MLHHVTLDDTVACRSKHSCVVGDSNAHITLPQCTCVVQPITHHSHNVTSGLKVADIVEFVLRRLTKAQVSIFGKNFLHHVAASRAVTRDKSPAFFPEPGNHFGNTGSDGCANRKVAPYDSINRNKYS